MPRTHTPYPPEFRAEAVRLARGSDKSIPALAADLGVSSEALRHWLRQANADEGHGRPGDLTTDEREELRRLRRENHVLKQEREILKKAAAFFAKETSCAGCWASPARRTTPGRAAGSRPAPRPTRP
jgi:transposase